MFFLPSAITTAQNTFHLPAKLAVQDWATVTPHLANAVWERDTDI